MSDSRVAESRVDDALQISNLKGRNVICCMFESVLAEVAVTQPSFPRFWPSRPNIARAFGKLIPLRSASPNFWPGLPQMVELAMSWRQLPQIVHIGEV